MFTTPFHPSIGENYKSETKQTTLHGLEHDFFNECKEGFVMPHQIWKPLDTKSGGRWTRGVDI